MMGCLAVQCMRAEGHAKESRAAQWSAAQGMSEGIQDIETHLITPDSIADEVCAVGLVAGGLLALHRAIATLAPYRVRCCSLPRLHAPFSFLVTGQPRSHLP